MKKLIQNSLTKLGGRNFSRLSVMGEEPMSEYMEGNMACAEVAHKLTNIALLYPITPSSPMGEYYEALSTKNCRNIFNTVPLCAQMQSEAGAAGAAHGAAVSGGLVTSFTSAQGLALWLPVLYLLSYQLHPFVLHVASRSMAGNATSILGDHNDVMGVRAGGFAMLSSRNPQECYDLAVISHMATLESQVPFIHFFGGQQVSNQINIVEKLSDDILTEIYPWTRIYEHMERGLSFRTPERTGSSCGHYTYQLNESVSPYYAEVSHSVENAMKKFEEVSGRHYDTMTYTGSDTAENIVVCMGTTSQDVEAMVEFLNKERNWNVGCVSIHLFRPFDGEKFCHLLPPTVKKIAVMDRCKEINAQVEPLCADVMVALQMSLNKDLKHVEVINGRYGIAQCATTPHDLLAVFENLEEYEPHRPFTLGIVDDVSHTSLLPSNAQDFMDKVCEDVHHAVFYGKGSDGTVSSVTASAHILGEHLPDCYSTGSNRHTPHKAGAITISELRWSEKGKINCGYPITNDTCEFVFCNNASYLSKFNMVGKLKPEGGCFVVNTNYDPSQDDVEEIIPNVVLKRMTQKESVKFVIVDAEKALEKADMPPGKINFVMLAAFLELSGYFSREEILEFLEDEIQRGLAGKGSVIQKNIECIKYAFEYMHVIDVKPEWKDLPTEEDPKYEKARILDSDEEWVKTAKEFVRDLQNPFIEQIEQQVPVSKFKPNGFTPLGTAKYEKRSIASVVPIWIPENCIQCNQCAFQCPHSVIRPYVFDEEVAGNREFGYEVLDFRGDGATEGDKFMIAISPNDCTGCLLCTKVCPVEALDHEVFTVPLRHELEDRFEVCENLNKNKKLQFEKEMSVGTIPLQNYFFEYNGACAGCAESAVIKIVSQLFGKRMLIANATGCTTVFSSYYITSPYTQNRFGCGPAYGRSLFENAAEYGLGMFLNTEKKRDILLETITKLHVDHGIFQGRLLELLDVLYEPIPKTNEEIKNEDELRPRPELLYFDDGDFTYDVYFGVNQSTLTKRDFQGSFFKKNELEKGIEYYLKKDVFDNVDLMEDRKDLDRYILLKRLKAFSHLMVKPSHWIVGGDGWAYDIGFGGLDHILSTGLPINIFILDNENYANTGGQASKASPLSVTHKLCTKGKETNKKDLASMAMTYGNVYVGQVSLLADPNHFVKTVLEAESYSDGPAIVVAYCPCEQHYIEGGLGLARKETEELAVKSGLFPLFNYNPFYIDETKRFSLRTKKITKDISEFISREKRFGKLEQSNPEKAERLQKGLREYVHWRMKKFQRLAGLDENGKKIKASPPPQQTEETEKVEKEE